MVNSQTTINLTSDLPGVRPLLSGNRHDQATSTKGRRRLIARSKIKLANIKSQKPGESGKNNPTKPITNIAKDVKSAESDNDNDNPLTTHRAGLLNQRNRKRSTVVGSTISVGEGEFPEHQFLEDSVAHELEARPVAINLIAVGAAHRPCKQPPMNSPPGSNGRTTLKKETPG